MMIHLFLLLVIFFFLLVFFSCLEIMILDQIRIAPMYFIYRTRNVSNYHTSINQMHLYFICMDSRSVCQVVPDKVVKKYAMVCIWNGNLSFYLIDITYARMLFNINLYKIHFICWACSNVIAHIKQTNNLKRDREREKTKKTSKHSLWMSNDNIYQKVLIYFYSIIALASDTFNKTVFVLW